MELGVYRLSEPDLLVIIHPCYYLFLYSYTTSYSSTLVPPEECFSCKGSQHFSLFFCFAFFSLTLFFINLFVTFIYLTRLPSQRDSELMETLLAHSFDYLSSYEPSKVRKGLRQVEGLLAHICLSKPKQSPVVRRRSLLGMGPPPPPPKALSELKDDPAFREFFKLQEGFQWNGMFLLAYVFLMACV